MSLHRNKQCCALKDPARILLNITEPWLTITDAFPDHHQNQGDACSRQFTAPQHHHWRMPAQEQGIGKSRDVLFDGITSGDREISLSGHHTLEKWGHAHCTAMGVRITADRTMMLMFPLFISSLVWEH